MEFVIIRWTEIVSKLILVLFLKYFIYEILIYSKTIVLFFYFFFGLFHIISTLYFCHVFILL